MIKSSLFEILRTLRKNELKRLEELIKSPYYNKNSNVIRLFIHVKKYYPDFNNEKLEKENIWNCIFKGRKFNYGIMKNLIYELNKLSEKFLELHEYEKKEFESGLNLINQLRQRNLNSRFEKVLKIYKERISRSEISITYYYYNHLIEDIEQFYYYESYKNKNKDYGNCKNINRYLFSYFFSTYFSQNHDALMSSKYFKVGQNTKDLEVMLEFFEKNNFEKDFLTMLYYYAVKLILNPQDEALYYESKRIFLKNLDKLDRATKYNIGGVLATYCAVHRMNGNLKFNAEQFEILKLTLKHNFYTKDDSEYFDPYIFSNIISLATHLKQIPWCYKFINEYSEKLNPVDKNNHYYLGMYALNGAQNKLDESLKCLSKVIPKNVMEKIIVKREEIKIYYDLKYFDEIYALIKSSKEYIKHDKASSDISLTGFKDYLDFMKRLVDLNINQDSHKNDKHNFEKLKKEITEKQFISKTWVLKRLENLEKSAENNNFKIPA